MCYMFLVKIGGGGGALFIILAKVTFFFSFFYTKSIRRDTTKHASLRPRFQKCGYRLCLSRVSPKCSYNTKSIDQLCSRVSWCFNCVFFGLGLSCVSKMRPQTHLNLKKKKKKVSQSRVYTTRLQVYPKAAFKS